MAYGECTSSVCPRITVNTCNMHFNSITLCNQITSAVTYAIRAELIFACEIIIESKMQNTQTHTHVSLAVCVCCDNSCVYGNEIH